MYACAINGFPNSPGLTISFYPALLLRGMKAGLTTRLASSLWAVPATLIFFKLKFVLLLDLYTLYLYRLTGKQIPQFCSNDGPYSTGQCRAKSKYRAYRRHF